MNNKNPSGNGLRSYAFHAYDNVSKTIVEALKEEQQILPNIEVKPIKDENKLDLETTARRYLTQVLDSNAVPALTARISDGVDSDFKIIKIETLQLTGTTFVKFRQIVHKIPVYGSLITVELDEADDLLAINSSVGAPIGVSPIAELSPAGAIKIVASDPDYQTELSDVTPMLNYFYDSSKSKWRLVYILQDVPITPKKTIEYVAILMDYIIDAHTRKMVSKLHRTSNTTRGEGIDGLGVLRSFRVDKLGNSMILKDSRLNIDTYDCKFRDLSTVGATIPGDVIKDTLLDPPSFPPSAVSAHANTTIVAEFMQDKLYRNNIDGIGGTIISSINCITHDPSGPKGKIWRQAMWSNNQMLYGQMLIGKDKKLRSLATELDIVAHEMFHGVTQYSARLEYHTQSGALNESYSDIFGIIIKNITILGEGANQKSWDWEIGKGVGDNESPLRNLSNPLLQNQPAHFDDHQYLANTKEQDYGGVHINSGIHNKAAYNILTSENNGNLIFSPLDVASIFYIALTQHLKEHSQFADSRRAVKQSALTFFRLRTKIDSIRLVRAIETAFDNVGLSGTYEVGDFAQGGIVIYVDKTGQHGLVCAKVDQSARVRWGASREVVNANGDGVYAGKANTASIIRSQVALGDDSSPYAASICKEYNGGGHTDWYLPSKRELDLMYINKAVIIATAAANGGTDLSPFWYLSSTEVNNDSVWKQYFSNGILSMVYKNLTYNVRAVRAF